MNGLNQTYIDRFWSKVDKSGDCWEWIAGKDRRGYGFFAINCINKLAHRVSYFIRHGDVIGNLFVCHKCDNPSCVNPDHLFLGTQYDNMKDAKAKGRLRMDAFKRHPSINSYRRGCRCDDCSFLMKQSITKHNNIAKQRNEMLKSTIK